jgi:hypothetical protein
MNLRQAAILSAVVVGLAGLVFWHTVADRVMAYLVPAPEERVELASLREIPSLAKQVATHNTGTYTYLYLKEAGEEAQKPERLAQFLQEHAGVLNSAVPEELLQLDPVLTNEQYQQALGSAAAGSIDLTTLEAILQLPEEDQSAAWQRKQAAIEGTIRALGQVKFPTAMRDVHATYLAGAVALRNAVQTLAKPNNPDWVEKLLAAESIERVGRKMAEVAKEQGTRSLVTKQEEARLVASVWQKTGLEVPAAIERGSAVAGVSTASCGLCIEMEEILSKTSL